MSRGFIEKMAYIVFDNSRYNCFFVAEIAVQLLHWYPGRFSYLRDAGRVKSALDK